MKKAFVNPEEPMRRNGIRYDNFEDLPDNVKNIFKHFNANFSGDIDHEEVIIKNESFTVVNDVKY